MTNVDKARELVQAHTERVHLMKVNQAAKLVEIADVNIIESATRGGKFTDIGLRDYHDEEVINIALEEIRSNGYSAKRLGNYIRIEW